MAAIETVANLAELAGAAGLDSLDQLGPKHINHRVQGTEVKTYEQLYPLICPNSLLDGTSLPDEWEADWNAASANSWQGN